MSKTFLFATGLALLFTGWSQAAAIPPASPFFTLQMTDWAPEEAFVATANSDDTFVGQGSGYFQNELCPPNDWECQCTDPRAVLNGGGDPIDFTGTYDFSADADGGVSLDFENFGPDIKSFLITTKLTKAQLDEVFTCSSDLFSFCGFKLSGRNLDVLFTDPINSNGIITATPEPAQYALLLAAFAGVLAFRRWRSKRLSA